MENTVYIITIIVLSLMGTPSEVKMAPRVMRAESNFNHRAVSPTGDYGLYQGNLRYASKKDEIARSIPYINSETRLRITAFRLTYDPFFSNWWFLLVHRSANKTCKNDWGCLRKCYVWGPYSEQCKDYFVSDSTMVSELGTN